MNLRISATKRAIEAMELRKDALASQSKTQFGQPLQIMQNEHPSADKTMFPIGQISLH